jgi:hypothetical protein
LLWQRIYIALYSLFIWGSNAILLTQGNLFLYSEVTVKSLTMKKTAESTLSRLNRMHAEHYGNSDHYSPYSIQELCRVVRVLKREVVAPFTMSLLGYSDHDIADSIGSDPATVRLRIETALVELHKMSARRAAAAADAPTAEVAGDDTASGATSL